MEMFLLLFLGGLLAGMLGGMLGIGGGVLIMPILRFFVGLPPAIASGTCIIAVFFTTLGGSIRHYRQNNIKYKSLLPILISGTISTVLFSFVFLILVEKGRWLDFGIGLVFMIVSTRMLIEGIANFAKNKSTKKQNTQMQGSIFTKISIGAFAGILPGLFGIGTGAILVPAFTFILKAPIKIAIGSSLACFCVNAFMSSGMKISQGFVDYDSLIPICIGTLVGSYLGAVFNKKISGPILKIMFGLLFCYVSLKYILLFING